MNPAKFGTFVKSALRAKGIYVSNAEMIEDFDKIRKAIEHALTYPQKEKLGEEAYRKAHEELSAALYSLARLERVCAHSDIGTNTYIPGKGTL